MFVQKRKRWNSHSGREKKRKDLRDNVYNMFYIDACWSLECTMRHVKHQDGHQLSFTIKEVAIKFDYEDNKFTDHQLTSYQKSHNQAAFKVPSTHSVGSQWKTKLISHNQAKISITLRWSFLDVPDSRASFSGLKNVKWFN